MGDPEGQSEAERTSARAAAKMNQWRSRLAGWLPPQRDVAGQPSKARPIASRGKSLDKTLVPGLRLLNNEATRRLDGQQTSANQLDTKAGAMVTLSLTGAGLFIAHGRSVAGGFAVAGFLVAILLGVACLGIRNFSDAPQPAAGPEFEHEEEFITLDRLVRVKALAYEHNRATMDAKAEWLKIMTWWMSVPVISAVVSFYSEKG